MHEAVQLSVTYITGKLYQTTSECAILPKGEVVMYLSHRRWASSVDFEVLYGEKVLTIRHANMEYLTGPLVSKKLFLSF